MLRASYGWLRVAVVAVLFAWLPIGCGGLEEESEIIVEEVQTSAAALAIGGGGLALTGKKCTDCGCRLEFVGWQDGCRKYKCVCDTEQQAKCAAGTTSATRSLSGSPSLFTTQP